jgi:hypothetical protein
MAKQLDFYEIVKKLIGPIIPVGDSNIDEQRFENLKNTTELLDKLFFDINQVAQYSNSQESSCSRSGKYAKEYLKNLEEENKENEIDQR